MTAPPTQQDAPAIERPLPTVPAPAVAERHLRRNLVLVLGEIISFGVGFAFADQNTVLVSFIATLTGSAIWLGLLPTVFQISVGLPQLFAARYLANRPRKLPWIIWTSVVRNVPLFALAAIAWARPGPVVLLVAFFLCYALFAIGMGAESVGWLDVFAKICPPERRGQVFAAGRTIGNLLSFGAGFLVARILAADDQFPRNYALLFLLTAIGLTIAMLSFAFIKEPIERPAPVPSAAVPQVPPDDRAVIVQGRRVWRQDAQFRRYVIARTAYVAHLVAVPFYLKFARDFLGIGDEAVGSFVSALMAGQIVANLVWGWLSARFGNRLVVQGSLLLALMLPLYVLLTPHLPEGAFLLVYVLTGAIMAGEIIGWMNLLLEISPAPRRPLYISLQSTLLLPANLLPLAGGLILSVVPYGVFFPAIAVALAISLWLVTRIEPRIEPRTAGAS